MWYVQNGTMTNSSCGPGKVSLSRHAAWLLESRTVLRVPIIQPPCPLKKKNDSLLSFSSHAVTISASLRLALLC